LRVLKNEALRSAEKAEDAIQSGRYIGPLHGVPIAIKDIFATKGILTTSGSKILSGYVPTYNATIVERLKKAGAILIGKLNLHEFACGSVESPHYGPVRNPWCLDRVTGGSSSGSGAAVAAGLCFGSVGTDTGGSIRVPASLCGITGLKPTYGLLSRYGVTPLSWSLDHVGPMTRCVEDAALMLEVLAGKDSKDPTTATSDVPNYRKALNDDLGRIRIGVSRDYFFELIDEEVNTIVNKAICLLEELGADVEEITYPHMKYNSAVFSVIMTSEASSYHEKYMTSNRGDYDPYVWERLQPGRFIPATQYLKAQRVREIIRREVEASLKRLDVVVTPTTPIPAYRFDEKNIKVRNETMAVRMIIGNFTRPFNLAGLPAISVPCGFTSTRLPIGLQIVGKAFGETTVLKVADAYEKRTSWRDARPPI
jgi:aspartyl-tRNA(Asn)/glutamyl-tRNA(Gln) amidotransferase subunit A